MKGRNTTFTTDGMTDDGARKVLSHWDGVIGARIGEATVIIRSCDVAVELEGVMCGGSAPRMVTQRRVRSDFEPFLITGSLGGMQVAAVTVLRHAPLRTEVLPDVATPSNDAGAVLVLVERHVLPKWPLHFYDPATDSVCVAMYVDCEITFTVRDLCPSTVCVACHRLSQRCQCLRAVRDRRLDDAAWNFLVEQLKLACSANPPIVALAEHSVPSGAGEIEKQDRDRDANATSPHQTEPVQVVMGRRVIVHQCCAAM